MKFFASVFNFSRGSFVDEVDTSTAVVRLRMAENEFPHSPQKFPSSCVWLQTGQVLMGVTPFLVLGSACCVESGSKVRFSKWYV